MTALAVSVADIPAYRDVIHAQREHEAALCHRGPLGRRLAQLAKSDGPVAIARVPNGVRPVTATPSPRLSQSPMSLSPPSPLAQMPERTGPRLPEHLASGLRGAAPPWRPSMGTGLSPPGSRTASPATASPGSMSRRHRSAQSSPRSRSGGGTAIVRTSYSGSGSGSRGVLHSPSDGDARPHPWSLRASRAANDALAEAAALTINAGSSGGGSGLLIHASPPSAAGSGSSSSPAASLFSPHSATSSSPREHSPRVVGRDADSDEWRRGGGLQGERMSVSLVAFPSALRQVSSNTLPTTTSPPPTVVAPPSSAPIPMSSRSATMNTPVLRVDSGAAQRSAHLHLRPLAGPAAPAPEPKAVASPRSKSHPVSDAAVSVATAPSEAAMALSAAASAGAAAASLRRMSGSRAAVASAAPREPVSAATSGDAIVDTTLSASGDVDSSSDVKALRAQLVAAQRSQSESARQLSVLREALHKEQRTAAGERTRALAAVAAAEAASKAARDAAEEAAARHESAVERLATRSSLAGGSSIGGSTVTSRRGSRAGSTIAPPPLPPPAGTRAQAMIARGRRGLSAQHQVHNGNNSPGATARSGFGATATGAGPGASLRVSDWAIPPPYDPTWRDDPAAALLAATQRQSVAEEENRASRITRAAASARAEVLTLRSEVERLSEELLRVGGVALRAGEALAEAQHECAVAKRDAALQKEYARGLADALAALRAREAAAAAMSPAAAAASRFLDVAPVVLTSSASLAATTAADVVLMPISPPPAPSAVQLSHNSPLMRGSVSLSSPLAEGVVGTSGLSSPPWQSQWAWPAPPPPAPSSQPAAVARGGGPPSMSASATAGAAAAAAGVNAAAAVYATHRNGGTVRAMFIAAPPQAVHYGASIAPTRLVSPPPPLPTLMATGTFSVPPETRFPALSWAPLVPEKSSSLRSPISAFSMSPTRPPQQGATQRGGKGASRQGKRSSGASAVVSVSSPPIPGSGVGYAAAAASARSVLADHPALRRGGGATAGGGSYAAPRAPPPLPPAAMAAAAMTAAVRGGGDGIKVTTSGGDETVQWGSGTLTSGMPRSPLAVATGGELFLPPPPWAGGGATSSGTLGQGASPSRRTAGAPSLLVRARTAAADALASEVPPASTVPTAARRLALVRPLN